MDLNLKEIPPAHFLLAVDERTKSVYGFSVIGNKIGLTGDNYTQLLSAVREQYRGQGIYRNLINFLSQKSPPEASLFNVTHIDNHKIQRAYAASGRMHLADTVVLRRVLES